MRVPGVGGRNGLALFGSGLALFGSGLALFGSGLTPALVFCLGLAMTAVGGTRRRHRHHRVSRWRRRRDTTGPGGITGPGARA